jgi:hypothetical protein
MTTDQIAEKFSRGDRDFTKRWLSAKQRQWLLDQWVREGNCPPGGSFPRISGVLADGAHWCAAYFQRGTMFEVGPNAAQMEARRLADIADSEFFF